VVSSRLRAVVVGLLTLAVGPASAQTTTYTWSGAGGDGNWSTSANWGGTAPASSLTNTRINLTGATNTTTTIDAFYGSTLQVLGLTVATNAGPFVVGSSGAVLEIGAEGVTFNGGGSDQTIAAPVRLGADQMWVNAGTGHLKLTGSVDTNGRTLTLGKVPSSGEGRWWIDLLGPVTGSGRLTAAGRVTMRGANTYSGGTTVADQGWLVVDSAANLGTGQVSLNNRGTLTLEAAVDSTLAGPLVVTNTGGNDWGSIQVNPAGATLRFQPGGLQGTGDLDLSGFGTKILTGHNSLTGRISPGTGGRLELIDSGGGASIAARGFDIYQTTFRVGPGTTLAQAPGASSRPYLGISGDGRVELEQSQHLSGATLGYADGSSTNPTLVTAPGVTLTLDNGFTGYNGTVNAVLAGSSGSSVYFVKGDESAGTMTVSGLSTFTGAVRVDSGVLSVDSLKPTGQPSALGVGGDIWLFRSANTSSTLRYTGPSTTTDRRLLVSGIDLSTARSFVGVTDPAATLTWTGPVQYSVNTSVPNLQKTGAGTLEIASTGNSFHVPSTGNGIIGVQAGTLSVTGSMEAMVTVESGATAAGRLVGSNTRNYRVVVGGGAIALTAKAGGTVRAGTGSSADVLGVDGVWFQAGSRFAVTVDGGASPTSSKILNSTAGNAIAFSPETTDAGRIRLMLEKGSGAEFVPYQPVTVEIARGGIYKRIGQANSAFTFDPNEWTLVTSGFDIVPGSFSLFTTENGEVLNAQFTPVPEPGLILAVGAVILAGGAIRRRGQSERGA